MQNLKDHFGEYSDVLDTDFSNWEDDYFSENTQFSDTENVLDSKNLIKSLQSTSNKISTRNGISSLCQKESSCHKNVSTLTSTEIKLSKSDALKELRNDIPQKDHKEIMISSRNNKNKRNIRKIIEHSDSGDSFNPNKKHKRSKMDSMNIFIPEKDSKQTSFPAYSVKTYQETSTASVKRILHLSTSKSQSDAMTVYSQETCYNQRASQMSTPSQEHLNQKMSTSIQKISTSSQEDSSQKMSTSSQEDSSQKMSTSSQETLNYKMVTSSQEFSNQKISTSSQELSASQKMIALSQENFDSQIIFPSQEFNGSPKMIKSSQESLGNQVMNISIEEDSIISNVTNQSNSETLMPHRKNFNYEKILGPEVKCTNVNILNYGTGNSKKRKMGNQQSLDSCRICYKKAKVGFQEKFTENLANVVSDKFCIKTCRRYNKAEKRIFSNIRKRELEVTKRENAAENREKVLDAREAEIQKREDILIAKERRYLKCKANMKKIIQKLTIRSDKFERENVRLRR